MCVLQVRLELTHPKASLLRRLRHAIAPLERYDDERKQLGYVYAQPARRTESSSYVAVHAIKILTSVAIDVRSASVYHNA